MGFIRKYRKYIAVFLIITILSDVFFPTSAWALTSGPASPEFSSFEPISTTNMVNESTGGVTYNLPIIEIPGPDGGGYAMSLSYHSGVSPEEEASWVGYGWSLNPGAINRGTRGFPDDWNGKSVTYKNKNIPNRTIALSGDFSLEAFSFGSLSVNNTLRYNNYKGFGMTNGIGVNFFGVASLGYNISDGDGSFSYSINPAAILSKKIITSRKKIRGIQKQLRKEGNTEKRKELIAKLKNLTSGKNNSLNATSISNSIASSMLSSSSYGLFSHTEAGRPSIATPFSGNSYSASIGLQTTPSIVQIGFNVTASLQYTTHSNITKTSRAYGYMYTNDNSYGQMQDYHYEKESNYNKRDVFIGIPFNNADNFSVTGEGIVGGFRVYPRKIGSFAPANVTSSTCLSTIGAEIELGLNNGGGGQIQIGFQNIKVKNWSSASSSNFSYHNDNSTDEPIFFRFNGDMGGDILYSNNDKIEFVNAKTTGTLGVKKFYVTGKKDAELEFRGMRSSYIGYTLNQDMLYNINGVPYKAYSKRQDLNELVQRDGSAIKDQIGEFSIVNEGGVRYNYALPVYSRKESSLSYGIELTEHHCYIDYHNITDNQAVEIGEVKNTPYATTFLLTEILTPDYIDRTNNGPSSDDFGGYTKFVYDRYRGTYDKNSDNSNDWYKWRSPYNGVFVNRNELSNIKDNMGSVSQGEKEIYYLDSILTKTHLAVFYKSERNDSYEASHIEYNAAVYDTSMGKYSMLKLDSIELYALGTTSQLLKTVHFDYDYSLAEGVINNDNENSLGTGKLTLKKVWTDYNGVYSPTISPYEFMYRYPQSGYPEEYQDLYMSDLYHENPDYNPRNIDAWGNYQQSGEHRYCDMKTWLNQTPSITFDPAAWQLKQIKLPSGGEIHMQYEQHDYSYVQDQLAHVMTNLSSYDDGVAVIDLANLDLNETETLILKDLIQKYYVDGNKKMYFKFLYKLFGDGYPSINDYTSEYIDGYVNIKQVYCSGTKIKLIFEDNNYSLPKQVCTDYVKSQRAGNLNPNSGSGPSFGGNALEIVDQFIQFAGSFALPNLICANMDETRSYLRIPSFKDKKGGGIRVKRLLMYDNGIVQGQPALYGNEYIYKFKDESEKPVRFRSSGVASNEPENIREENVLIQPIERIPQSLYSKIISGRDKKQVEGPIGESILPAASINYSRVVVKNIHSGKTSPGYTVKKFYTFRNEFNKRPLINTQESRYSALDNDAKDYFPFMSGIYNYMVNNIGLSQGFLFEITDLNGKPKSNTIYSGSYNFDYVNQTESTNGIVASSEEFEYFDPKEGVPILNNFSDLIGMQSWDDLEKRPLGKEVDMTFAAKTVQDHYNDFRYEFDADVGFIGPIPIPFFSMIPYINDNETEMYLHATNKVIRYPAIIKKIKTKVNNVIHITENKAFDPKTGKPLIIVNSDGFYKPNGGLNQDFNYALENGTMTTYNIPAWQEYKQMGQISENEKAHFKSTSSNPIKIAKIANDFYLVFSSTDGSELTPKNTPLPILGDLIKIEACSNNNNNDKATFICNIVDKTGNYYKLEETYYSRSQDFVRDDFIGEIQEFTTLRSANTNILKSKVSSFTVYGDTIPKITADSLKLFKGSIRTKLAKSLNNIDTFLINDISGIENLLCSSNYDTVIVDFNHEDSILIYQDGNQSSLIYDPNTNTGSRGSFAIDTLSGRLIYVYGDGNMNNFVFVDGFDFCGDTLGKIKIQNVIANSQTVYSDKWPYNSHNYYPLYTLPYNNYDKGTKGKYRQFKNYVYKAPIRSVITDDALNLSSGMYELEYFNINNRGFASNDYTKWLCTSTTNEMSPNGNALEEENILGIKSSAKYGYHNTVPYLMAGNTDYHFVWYESFENIYQSNENQYFEDGLVYNSTNTSINKNFAHTGHQSLEIPSGNSFVISSIESNPELQALLNSNTGLLSKIWVKASDNSNPSLKLRIRYLGANLNFAYTHVAQIGYWNLYQTQVHSTDINSEFSIEVVNTGLSNLIIDDFRLQPTDAQLKAFVYDSKTLKPIAIFDDQHFALLYQYNAEGKLVRKLKETVKGVKTITETQYNSVKQPRP